jgi:hypothetical protein
MKAVKAMQFIITFLQALLADAKQFAVGIPTKLPKNV